MRIGLFSESYFPTPDGVAFFLRDLAGELRRQGHEVVVFTAGDKDSFDDEVYVFKGPEFPPYPTYRFIFTRIRDVQMKAKEFGPDIINIHSPFTVGSSGYQSGRRLGVPVVATYHTNVLEMGSHLRAIRSEWMMQFLAKVSWRYNIFLYNLCEAVTAPTGRSGDFIREHGLTQEVHTIWNGIDIDSFRGEDILPEGLDIPEGPMVLYVGRLTADKGIHNIALAAERIKDAVFVFAGEGREHRRLEREVERLGIGDRARVLGFVDDADKKALYRHAKIFCLPSKADNFPITMLEAMAAGCTIIGGDSGGVPDVIVDGKTGLLVPFGEVDPLVTALERLLSDEDLRDRLSSNAMKRLEGEWSIQATARQYVEVYKQVLASNQK